MTHIEVVLYLLNWECASILAQGMQLLPPLLVPKREQHAPLLPVVVVVPSHQVFVLAAIEEIGPQERQRRVCVDLVAHAGIGCRVPVRLAARLTPFQ